jgi:hypothetical protein
MDETLHTTLAHWANFYLITGTAAASLTGLQFVVQSLMSTEALRPVTSRDPATGIGAFGSPTVVHFSLALLLSALMCVPWTGYGPLQVSLGTLGASAVVYSAIVLRRTVRQRIYVPAFEDWLFHIVLPSLAYVSVLASAALLDRSGDGPLFAIAAATLLLLCVGIHNAWDTVTYMMIAALRVKTPPGGPAAPPPAAPPPAAPGKRRRRHR